MEAGAHTGSGSGSGSGLRSRNPLRITPLAAHILSQVRLPFLCPHGLVWTPDDPHPSAPLSPDALILKPAVLTFPKPSSCSSTAGRCWPRASRLQSLPSSASGQQHPHLPPRQGLS